MDFHPAPKPNPYRRAPFAPFTPPSSRGDKYDGSFDFARIVNGSSVKSLPTTVLDTFTGAAGTSIFSRTTDSGHSWQQDVASSVIVITNANRARGSSPPSNTATISNWIPPSAGYEVLCDYHGVSTVGLSQTGIITKRIASPNDYLSFYTTTTAINYRRLTNGINGNAIPVITGLTYPFDMTLKVRNEGGTITVSQNGTVVKRWVLSYDTSIELAGAGKIGIQAFNQPTNTQGCHLDNFTGQPASNLADIILVAEGDSLTASQHALDGSNPALNETEGHITQALNLFTTPNRWRCSNFATGGHTIAQRQAAYATGAALQYDSTKTRNIMWFMGGTNDIIQSQSAATIQTRLQTYWQTAIATGFRLIVGTIPPTTSWGTGPLDVIRLAVNTWIKANAISLGCFAVVDIAAKAELTDPSNVTYYFLDGTHWNATGCGIVASITQPQFELAV